MLAAAGKIAHWLRNRPVFFKIATSTFVTVAIPVLVLMLVLIGFSNRTAREHLQSQAESSAGYAALRIENLFDDCQLIGRSIASSKVVQETLTGSDPSTVFSTRAVSTAIDNAIKSGNTIHSALIYSLTGDIYASSGVNILAAKPKIPLTFNSTAEMMHQSWPVIRRSNAPNLYHSPIGHSEYLQFIMPIFDAETAAGLGLCEINVPEDTLLGLLAPYRYPGTHYVLYNSYGDVLSESSYQLFSAESIQALLAMNLSGVSTVQVDGQLFEICTRRIPGFATSLLVLVSPGSTDLTLPVYLTILAASVLVLLGLTSFVQSKAITKNLVILTQHVDQIKHGDLDDVIPVRSNDEVGRLSEDFNQMTARIKALIEQNQAVSTAKRRSDLAALQAQINPHFLYNTLESVSALIMLNRDEDALLLSKSLSSYYQIVLSNGVTMISLRDELRNVDHYLIIQKMRYGNKINYSIHAEEELMDYLILKLSVQPLVENAIYHGLRQKQGANRIDILCSCERDQLLVSVRDDGIGIQEKDITHLFKPGNTEYSNRGFGLRSIDERIKLQYGQDYGLEMCSEPGEWTEFTIRVPLTTQKDREAVW